MSCQAIVGTKQNGFRHICKVRMLLSQAWQKFLHIWAAQLTLASLPFSTKMSDHCRCKTQNLYTSTIYELEFEFLNQKNNYFLRFNRPVLVKTLSWWTNEKLDFYASNDELKKWAQNPTSTKKMGRKNWGTKKHFKAFHWKYWNGDTDSEKQRVEKLTVASAVDGDILAGNRLGTGTGAHNFPFHSHFLPWEILSFCSSSSGISVVSCLVCLLPSSQCSLLLQLGPSKRSPWWIDPIGSTPLFVRFQNSISLLFLVRSMRALFLS